MSIAGELERLNSRQQSKASVSYSHQRVCASTFFASVNGLTGSAVKRYLSHRSFCWCFLWL